MVPQDEKNAFVPGGLPLQKGEESIVVNKATHVAAEDEKRRRGRELKGGVLLTTSRCKSDMNGNRREGSDLDASEAKPGEARR